MRPRALATTAGARAREELGRAVVKRPPSAVETGVAVSRVLFVWLALLFAEQFFLGTVYREYFAGMWELKLSRTLAIPIALAAAPPLAFAAVFAGKLGRRTGDSMAARLACVVMVGVGAFVVAAGISSGRHVAGAGLRAPFVAAVVLVATLMAWWVVPLLAALGRRGPWLAILGGVVAVGTFAGDAFVLPRLYPAFHAALFVLTLASSALVATAWRGDSTLGRTAAGVACLAAIAAVIWAPFAARRLSKADNLRLALVEHAPLLGRAVLLANLIAPPAREDAVGEAATLGTGEIPRALDWTGRDVVLISVDAMRADHVHAYGYPRATTPNLDALAARGAVFSSAYCPTPHTSYSITSMMTGKYMRPLLALGAGQGSETWALDLRRYGYHTAAFYPPAVFFVDETRFTEMEKRELDFEYAKVEFAAPTARAAELDQYLAQADPAKPLFAWVHFFEPHEPYVMHPEHPFGHAGETTDVDAYDSEIAAADEGIGAVVALVDKRRPGAAIVVTADHGEEFGEHGGRYHGTTVYEEQVRVPLVIAGPGVKRHHVDTVVQTIDLLPTVLSAVGIPRPARVRGRDLGPLLAYTSGQDPGFAFAETDDYALVAHGEDRLVCARRAAACALYRPKEDPSERRDLSTTSEGAPIAATLRRELRTVEADAVRFEAAAPDEPEALRRGKQGDAEAAEDVAALLDDANLAVRREAALVTFELHDARTVAAARRAFARDEDDVVHRYAALAVQRMYDAGAPAGPDAPRVTSFVDGLLHDHDVTWRRLAALALAEHGDARGGDELAAWWTAEGPPKGAMELGRARELLGAMARVHDRAAVPGLVRSLPDVRARPGIADALGAIGDPSARGPLLAAFAEERYVTTRPHEALALVALGAHGELRGPLMRFAGLAEPMRDALEVATRAGLLDAKGGGWAGDPPTSSVRTSLLVPRGERLRLLALAARPGASLTGSLDGVPFADANAPDALHIVELPGRKAPGMANLELEEPNGLRAVWIVPRADELPPPPPAPWKPQGTRDP